MSGFGEGIGEGTAAALMAIAVVAAVVMWTSWFAAVRASRGHPEFDDHLEKRKIPGYDAIPHMPEQAKRHIRRHFLAFGIFLLVPAIIFFA